MKFRALTLVVTDACNFFCRYCYKGKRQVEMPESVLRQALGFFLPRARRDFAVNFYGGEPLLAFDLIQAAVARTRELVRGTGLRPRFSLTTNGSLLTEDVGAFLRANRFHVVLSYDGAAQDAQRAKGSASLLRERIRRILEAGRIRLEVNAVFTPANVAALAKTVLDLTRAGVPRIRYGLSALEPWNPESHRRMGLELKKIFAWALDFRRRGVPCPLVNIREDVPERLNSCPAGKDRLAVDTEGKVWGCALFSDYARMTDEPARAKRFCLGSISRLAADPDGIMARVLPRYRRLESDHLRSSSGPCFLCRRRGFCRVCPVNAALAGGRLGQIPDRICRLQKTRIAAVPAALLGGM